MNVALDGGAGGTASGVGEGGLWMGDGGGGWGSEVLWGSFAPFWLVVQLMFFKVA